jgi:hypothetical protein
VRQPQLPGLAAASASWPIHLAARRARREARGYLARLMLCGLALVTMLAQQPTGRLPTVTTEVALSQAPRSDSLLSILNNRLKIDATSSPDGVGISSTFWGKLRRGSVGVGLDFRSLSLPSWVPGSKTSEGWLASRIGHGLYFGHAAFPKASIFPDRETAAAKPTLRLPGANVRMDGAFFFTKNLGIRVDLSVGNAMYGAISFVVRGW